VRPENYLNTGFGFDLINDNIFVGAMIGNAGADMNFGDLFVDRPVPQADLGKTGNDGCPGTVAAVYQPYDFGIVFAIPFEFTGPPVKSHHAAGAANADIIHGFLTPNEQYFFHLSKSPSGSLWLY
jgi:hypothetical protein